MRSLPIVLVALAALLAPTATLAAGSASSPPSRAFIITGLALGSRTIETSGKISIDGGRLIASVGCNTIGGAVTLDGDSVTIPEPLAMTEMACPGPIGDAEAMLVKVLQAGPFRIADGAWRGTDAAILVDELPVAPGPGASPLPPDGVVSSSPEPGPVGPAVSCPPVPIGTNGTTPADGGPGAGSGSGTGGATGGSTGSAGGVAGGPGETGGSSGSGSGSSGSGSAPAATAIDLPFATAATEPGATAAIDPGPSVVAPPPPLPDGTPVLGQTEPEPSLGSDPGIGTPVSSDPCLERPYAQDQTGAGGVEPPKASDSAAEHAASAADPSLIVPLALGLALALLVAISLIRRRIARAVAAAGEGPTADVG